jgi:hypothetical protein
MRRDTDIRDYYRRIVFLYLVQDRARAVEHNGSAETQIIINADGNAIAMPVRAPPDSIFALGNRQRKSHLGDTVVVLGSRSRGPRDDAAWKHDISIVCKYGLRLADDAVLAGATWADDKHKGAPAVWHHITRWPSRQTRRTTG